MSDNSAGMTSGGRPNLNLSKMIRLDQVEDIMNSMMHRLDSQEATIVALKSLTSNLLTKHAANETFNNIQESMNDLAMKLDQVSDAATSNIGNGRNISAGELAHINHMNLQSLSKQISTCARDDDMKLKLNELNNNINDQLNIIKKSSTPIELGETLRRSQIDISKRLTTTETVLSQKVDRSEVGTLTSLAEALESYSSFRDDTIEAIKKQDIWNEMTTKNIVNHGNDLVAASSEREEIRKQAKLFATLESMEEIANALRSLAGMQNLCAAKKSVNELYEIVRLEQERSSRNEDYMKKLNIQLDHADIAISTKASIEDNKKNVLRRHYDEAISALGTDLDTKATSTRVRSAEDRVAVLEAELENANSRLGVAMRFVEWFTSRGENYEHNLRLVDKHLGKLTTASDPKVRNPYEGQVRFTGSSMADGPASSVFGGNAAAQGYNKKASDTSNIGNSFAHLL
jgi:hypothetical protein